MTRKEERELAFTLIFEKIFNDELSVDEIIENLPKGIDTLIGENGIKLSGGERRRLYLCTVLMQNPNFRMLEKQQQKGLLPNIL